MDYLKAQLLLHPSMQMQDVAKFCYQAVFGAEHLLQNEERAKAYLTDEFEQNPAADEPLFENISETYCRVNLGAWKKHGYKIDTLFSLFLQTARTPSGATAEAFESKLIAVETLALTGALPFSAQQWKDFLRHYDRKPLHHSAHYRTQEKPAYRVVLRHLVNLSTLCR